MSGTDPTIVPVGVSDLNAELVAQLARGGCSGRWAGTRQLSATPLSPANAFAMVRRRAVDQSPTVAILSALTLSYFEIGEILCDLAAAPVPALSGVTERHFDMAMHDDAERFRRFQASPLSLTYLGRSIVGGEDDWPRYNPIHRWWGGTRLTSQALWRWNSAEGRLLAPQF